MATNPKDLPEKSLEINSNLKLFQIYKNLKFTSLKIDSYFQIYEEIFNEYVGKEIIFVEVGVLHGGSLFMWKEYFGSKARIIGVDLDPKAKELEKEGFEIFIGSQSDNKFWRDFYSKVGKIDILLDDGGHLNEQQIVTVSESVNNIKNNGLIVTEDVHSSYLRSFGNPFKFSFINYSKYLVDVVNSRFVDLQFKRKNELRKKIFSISFYDSIVVFKINSKKSLDSVVIKNNEKERQGVFDYRTSDFFPKINNFINKKLPILKKLPVIKKMVRYFFNTPNFIVKLIYYFKLKKYFK